MSRVFQAEFDGYTNMEILPISSCFCIWHFKIFFVKFFSSPPSLPPAAAFPPPKNSYNCSCKMTTQTKLTKIECHSLTTII